MAWRTNADFYPLLHEQNKMNIWISGCLFGNLFNSAICLLFIYFPTKVFKKINKTGVEVIETPKLKEECFFVDSCCWLVYFIGTLMVQQPW